MAASGTDRIDSTSNTDVDPLAAPAALDASQPVSDETRPIALEQARAERRALIELCMYALDRARSTGVAERIERGLADVGVQAVRPDGECFDPTKHEAGATEPTEDTSLVGVIAETEVVGFSDHEGMVRVPIVTVYTSAVG